VASSSPRVASPMTWRALAVAAMAVFLELGVSRSP
jgi:hypothetical protein